jgi:GR25 family glycosyltransferase involved in LPS biosynthesis
LGAKSKNNLGGLVLDKNTTIKGFVINAFHETERIERVQYLLSILPDLQKMEAIYPSREKIPFLQKIKQKSLERTGYSLTDGEIGILLSSRKVWRSIMHQAENDEEFFLILESDSWINNKILLEKNFEFLAKQYDMFFFGSWLGNTKIFRSTREELDLGFVYGTPFMKTISGGYGYAINRKAAAYLLKKSAYIAHPVDEFKRYIEPGYLRIGAVLPEIISEKGNSSTIGERPTAPSKQKFKMILLNIRNTIICLVR